MPRIKSAQKRARQTINRTARNQHAKRLIRLTGQRLKRAVAANDKPAVASTRSELDSRLDRAAKKNLIHPHKVARKKSQAASMAKPVTAWSAPRSTTKTKPAKAPAKSSTTKTKSAKTTAKSSTTKAKPTKAAAKK